MRLSEAERRAITAAVAKSFGTEARVWLFGSRTDDTRRGGDTDLYVETALVDDIRSTRDLAGLLPLAAKTATHITTYDVDRIDLFLGRFAKFQDFLTTKLFRSLARVALENVNQDVSVFDTLARMEKFGVIDSLEEWATLRQLRNSFSHEYLLDAQEIADNVNRAYAGVGVLLTAMDRVRQFSVSRLGLDLLPCPDGDKDREPMGSPAGLP